MNKFVKAEHRFLLKLARQVLTLQPDVKTSELARQLGVGVRAAYNYRQAVAAGTPDPPDPVQLACLYLKAHPRATAQEIGRHLGLKRDAGRRYLEAALAVLARQQPALLPPARTYHVKKFSQIRKRK